MGTKCQLLAQRPESEIPKEVQRVFRGLPGLTFRNILECPALRLIELLDLSLKELTESSSTPPFGKHFWPSPAHHG